jgi:hypothetical protein
MLKAVRGLRRRGIFREKGHRFDFKISLPKRA